MNIDITDAFVHMENGGQVFRNVKRKKGWDRFFYKLEDGNLPIRRYAVFSGLFGDYMTVVRGEFDLAHAEKWGGFVKWLGGVRQAEQRVVKKPNAANQARSEAE